MCGREISVCAGDTAVCVLICKPSPEITSSARLSRSYCLLLFLIAACGKLLIFVDGNWFRPENEKVVVQIILGCLSGVLSRNVSLLRS